MSRSHELVRKEQLPEGKMFLEYLKEGNQSFLAFIGSNLQNKAGESVFFPMVSLDKIPRIGTFNSVRETGEFDYEVVVHALVQNKRIEDLPSEEDISEWESRGLLPDEARILRQAVSEVRNKLSGQGLPAAA